MNNKLPAGWTQVSLGVITEINPRHSKDWPDSTLVSFARMAALSDSNPDFQFLEYRPLRDVRRGFTHFADGDVLFAKITPCMENGKAAVARALRNGIGCGTTELHVLRSRGAIHANYLYHYLAQPSVRNAAKDSFTGTAGQARVPRSFIDRLEIPLPPFSEQQRIVAKLEALLSKVGASQLRLSSIRTLLQRLRHSVLACASSGALTAGWRQQNPNVESARILLGRIRKSRSASATTSKEKFQIEQLFHDEDVRDGDAEFGIDGIPDTWVTCRVGAIGNVSNGSTPSRSNGTYWGGRIPWISSGEVRNNVISESRERITKAGRDSSHLRILPRGSVLLAMIGEGKTRGQSALLGLEATINQNVAAVVLEHRLVSSKYVWRWFQLQYNSTRQRGSGSGPQALNCQRVRQLPFVLPPLAEQHEIVRRVDALFALTDQIEAKSAAAQSSIDAMRASLLAKAFRGELVLTEAELARQEQRSYESASISLQNVKSNSAARNNSPSLGSPRTQPGRHLSKSRVARSRSDQKRSTRR